MEKVILAHFENLSDFRNLISLLSISPEPFFLSVRTRKSFSLIICLELCKFYFYESSFDGSEIILKTPKFSLSRIVDLAENNEIIYTFEIPKKFLRIITFYADFRLKSVYLSNFKKSYEAEFLPDGRKMYEERKNR